jgi:hypothetical protein
LLAQNGSGWQSKTVPTTRQAQAGLGTKPAAKERVGAKPPSDWFPSVHVKHTPYAFLDEKQGCEDQQTGCAIKRVGLLAKRNVEVAFQSFRRMERRYVPRSTASTPGVARIANLENHACSPTDTEDEILI